jgi:hypothetical protein
MGGCKSGHRKLGSTILSVGSYRNTCKINPHPADSGNCGKNRTESKWNVSGMQSTSRRLRTTHLFLVTLYSAVL